MRSLAQPKVLARALFAGLVTSLACYPRLDSWTARGAPVPILWVILLWSMFVLWGFVFAWHFQYSNRPVFVPDKFEPILWEQVSLGAIAAAVLMHFLIDPQNRLITPETYPTSFDSWTRMSLFAIALQPLFFCFAPFAFFIRLLRKQDTAIALTVVFGLFVLTVKLGESTVPAPFWTLVELVCLQVLAVFAGLYLYLKGGALLVWWAFLILQLRFFLDFVGKH